MNECTYGHKFHPGKPVLVPALLSGDPCDANLGLRLKVIGIVKESSGLNVTISLWDPVCRRNPEMFGADEITLPAMMISQ